MPRPATVPESLRYVPFRGSTAVARGLLTRGQLAGPAWRRLLRDVYVCADVPVDHLTWCRAASLLLPASPLVALSHRSAAFLYGVNLLPRTQAAVDLTVPPSSRIRPGGGLVVHRAHLLAVDRMRRSGLWVTSPDRTAFDLGRHADEVQAVVALDALLHQRVVKPVRLDDIAAGRAGWRGVGRFRAAVRLARPGVESPMETRLRLVLVRGGLPEPSVQYTVLDRAGHFVARLDLAYEAIRLGLEYDGDQHRERAVFQRDALRRNKLRLCGWTVLRFTADDVLRHPDRVVEQVRMAIKIATNGTLRRS